MAYLLDLVFPKYAKGVDNDPWERSSEIHEFVHRKGHDAGRKDIVLHIRIPGLPQPLKHIEMDIILGDLFEGAPERLGRRKERAIPIVGLVSIRGNEGGTSQVHFARTAGPKRIQ